jgi:hypothetical protein
MLMKWLLVIVALLAFAYVNHKLDTLEAQLYIQAERQCQIIHQTGGSTAPWPCHVGE